MLQLAHLGLYANASEENIPGALLYLRKSSDCLTFARRALQEEEEELSGFMHGGEAASGMRGAKAGSESDGADSIEQRWRDIEGTPSFSEDQLASEGGAGRMGRAPFSRNISTLSHLGSSDSLHRIVAEVSARVFCRREGMHTFLGLLLLAL